MNKRIENLVKRVEKNNGKSVTLRRDVLVKMAQEQLFDYMDSYSYDDMFGVSEGKGIKGDFTESCEDVRRSSVGFCSVRIVDNKLKFYCHIHSNSSFNLYIELNKDKKESEEIKILEDVKVELNNDKNGVEIYFSNKPSEEVRNNLKSHGFRWSKYNKCWYAKQSEDTLNFANSLLPKEDDKINDLSKNTEAATEEVKQDPQIEKWNNKLNTRDAVIKQLNALKRYVIKRKKDTSLLNCVPVNGYIISKLLQLQGQQVQYNKADFKKCYYIVSDSTPEAVKIAFKDSNNNLQYYVLYTDKITISSPQNDSLDMNLQLLSRKNDHIDTLESNLYTFTDDVERLNSDILEYNKQVECMSKIKGTAALELYKIENKCNLEKRIEKVINENKIYNIKPIQIINIENDSIKKSYFDSKRNTYDDLLKSKDNNNSYHKSLSTYTVNKIFKFTNEDYDIITNNLMCHMNFLEGFGGSAILENGNYLNHLSILITNQNGKKGILIDPQDYPYARYVGVIDIETLKEYLKLSTNETQYNKNTAVSCKEVLKETEDYILFKKGNIYVLRYFDECIYHEKYDRNKKITQSRITKHYDNIKHLLE